jgi:hypothetical protein
MGVFSAIGGAGLAVTLSLAVIFALHIFAPQAGSAGLEKEVIYLDVEAGPEEIDFVSASRTSDGLYTGSYQIILLPGTGERAADERVSRPEQRGARSCLTNGPGTTAEKHSS